ncbi:MAG: DUF2231 domain-containing protein [Roseiflexaceae bacterium]
MPPLHPITVHLPIGLLIGNCILTLLFLRRRDTSLEQAAYHCLWLGTILILPAIAAGTWDAVQALNQPNQHPEALMWINAHAISGGLLLVVYWQAWQIRRRNPHVLSDPAQQRGYLSRIFLGTGLLVLSGWMGGHMVYELGIGTR